MWGHGGVYDAGGNGGEEWEGGPPFMSFDIDSLTLYCLDEIILFFSMWRCHRETDCKSADPHKTPSPRSFGVFGSLDLGDVLAPALLRGLLL